MLSKRHKKGLIFALDAALAVTVVVVMVINSSFYFSIAGKSSLSHMQLMSIGGDILTILDYTGDLENVVLNDTLYENLDIIPGVPSSIIDDGITDADILNILNITTYLPPNYDMWVSISDLKETVIQPRLIFPPVPCFTSGITSLNAASLVLERDMDALFEVNMSFVDGGASFHIEIANDIFPPVEFISESYTLTENGTYIFGPFPFDKDLNSISFIPDGTSDYDDLCPHWFRVKGSEAYSKSTNEAVVLPTDRFIAVGERVFTVGKGGTFLDGETPELGTRVARYKIWLKEPT